MPSEQSMKIAVDNYDRMSQNAYPGRVVIVGVDDTGQFIVQACATMGRSPGSRGRVYKDDGKGKVWTAPLDPATANDPGTENTLYTAMDQDVPEEYLADLVVSNGNHTVNILTADAGKCDFLEALLEREHEDDPYNTPRIGGQYTRSYGDEFFWLGIQKKSPFGDGCDRQLFHYTRPEPGIGWCIHTYHNADPSIPFAGEPFILPLIGGIYSVAEKLWGALNEENRVSLAVKFFERSTGATKVQLLNKYKQIVAT